MIRLAILLLGAEATRRKWRSMACFGILWIALGLVIMCDAIARGLPMICANPDLTMITAQGLIPAAGSIARLYEELGGAVTYVGKPKAPIYEECLRLLGRPDPSRVLTIGDSLDHDVRGGAGMGMGTVLITSGILGPEFAASATEAAMVETALRLASETGDRPDWLLPSLVW